LGAGGEAAAALIPLAGCTGALPDARNTVAAHILGPLVSTSSLEMIQLLVGHCELCAPEALLTEPEGCRTHRESRSHAQPPNHGDRSDNLRAKFIDAHHHMRRKFQRGFTDTFRPCICCVLGSIDGAPKYMLSRCFYVKKTSEQIISNLKILVMDIQRHEMRGEEDCSSETVVEH
jgi:hypothetical protein